MPEKDTIRRARRDAAAGKSASTQAGEFVREQIHRIREGRHGARSTRQAIAIGLSEARRSGVALPAPARRGASDEVRAKAKRDLKRGRRGREPSPTRSRASARALQREGGAAASTRALSAHARASARRRGHGSLSAAAKRAAHTGRAAR